MKGSRPQDVKGVPRRPGMEYERCWWDSGFSLVAGVDEVGRGALAGPVAAAAVIFPPYERLPAELAGVADSKLLSPFRRQALYPEIIRCALAYAIAFVTSSIIDQIGILPATHLAMARAVASLHSEPEVLLIDGEKLRHIPLPQETIVKGDRRCFCIAAASILAKVARDDWMKGAEGKYPGYGLARHKGYATAAHLDALEVLGPCEIHRRSFAPVARLLLTRSADE